VGGKGTNLAVAAARQGKQTAIIARVGDDSFADMAYALYTQEQIDARGVQRTPGEKTAVGLVYLQPSGENTIGLYRGANWRLSARDVADHFHRHTSARLAATQLEIPDEAVAATVQLGQSSGMQVVLNPAPARILSSEVLASVDVLTPNEGEARVLAGLAPNDESVGIVDVARRLMQQGLRAVVVTLGSKGCLVVQQNAEPLEIAALPVQPVDTVGAGDAFNGGLAVALTDGLPLDQAAWWATVTAALATTAVGAVGGLPTRAQVIQSL
jgi:ribokinase